MQMKKSILSVALALLVCGAEAETMNQSVTLDGAELSGAFVVSMTFDGDDVALTLDGGTVQTADISAVNIAITYGEVTESAGETANAVGAVEVTEVPSAGVYNLSGQYVGDTVDGLPRGLYIVNGEKTLVK